MKIDRIAFEQLYPTGAYSNQRLRVEVVIEGEDSVEEAFNHAKTLVNQTFEKLNPHITWNEDAKPKEEPVNQRIAQIIEDINSCTEVEAESAWGAQIGLIAYKEAAESNPEIKAAYDLKMAQLTKTNK